MCSLLAVLLSESSLSTTLKSVDIDDRKKLISLQM